jgi:hypothetical protein
MLMLAIFLSKVTETYFELGLALTTRGRDFTVAKTATLALQQRPSTKQKRRNGRSLLQTSNRKLVKQVRF